MIGIDAALPFEPQLARALGVEVVLDLEAHVARELLRVLADEQVVIGLLEHGLGDERRRAHAFDARHAAGALGRPVHAARVELHDAFGVGQAAVADAGVFGIELAQVDAGDDGVEHVGALRDHLERLLHAGDRPAVLVAVAVGRRDDDRLDRAGGDGRRLAEHGSRGGDGEAGGAGLDELAAGDFPGHGSSLIGGC